MIRTLLADDEPLAREGLRQLLADIPDVVIVGECGDGLSAIENIEREKPDLVLLDIRMPEMTGLEVAANLRMAPRPLIVFVTAFDEFAIEAFRVHAVDNLLKPVKKADLLRGMERIRTAIEANRQGQLRQQLEALLQHSAQPFPKRFLVRGSKNLTVVPAAEVDWIEAAGNYVNLHLGKKAYLYRETMNNLEQQLDPRKFVRIHRSRIVNVERICKLQSWSHGEYVIIMKDDTELLLTRTYRENLLGLFERPAS